MSGKEDKERKESVRFSIIGNNLSKTSVNKSREQLMENLTQQEVMHWKRKKK